jgi:hypothetical protein
LWQTKNPLVTLHLVIFGRILQALLAILKQGSAVIDIVKAVVFSTAVVLLQDEGEEMAQPASSPSDQESAAEVGRQISSKHADWIINSCLHCCGQRLRHLR